MKIAVTHSRFFKMKAGENRQPWMVAYDYLKGLDLQYGDLIEDDDLNTSMGLVDPAGLIREDSNGWDLARLAQVQQLDKALKTRLGIVLRRERGIGFRVAHPEEVIRDEPARVQDTVTRVCEAASNNLKSLRQKDLTSEQRRMRDDALCRVDGIRSLAQRQLEKPFG